MKKTLKALSLLLVIWLGITVYFVAQHSVEGKTADLSKRVVFADLTIELQHTVVYNFKRRTMLDADYERESQRFKYKLLARLPQSLQEPYGRIAYLYSKPYETQKANTIAVFGKCSFTQLREDSTESEESNYYYDYFKNHVSIYFLDSSGVVYGNGLGTSYEDNSHELEFSVLDRNLSDFRWQEGMKLVVKHLESGETREFPLNPQDFVLFRHNDALGQRFPVPLNLS